MGNHDEGHRPDLLAGLYALYLRSQGISPHLAAECVMERYPGTRGRLAVRLGHLRKQGTLNAGGQLAGQRQQVALNGNPAVHLPPEREK
jgi:hypothetical protein